MTLGTRITSSTAHTPEYHDEPATADAATAEVREVFRKLYAAWDGNDADAFSVLYRDDATVVMPKVLHRNRKEIRSAMAASFRHFSRRFLKWPMMPEINGPSASISAVIFSSSP